MALKAAFHNLGCRVNEYETEAMAGELRGAGYEIVPFAPGADIYVINTCTVTNIADRKSRQMLHRAKEMNPDAVVVAAGCYVEDAGQRLAADPAVDILIGNDDKTRLPAILRAYFEDKKRDKTSEADLTSGDKGLSALRPIEGVRNYEELELSETTGRTRAFIKIQDGCNQFCSYCMIPYVRGRVRSRKLNDAVDEARRLSEGGYHEIVLTGIHISSYGLDFDTPGVNRQTPDASKAVTNERLLELIRRIAALPEVKRVRFGSLEPGIMTENFVRGLAEIPEICPQFHLSLQSGCDATLKRMRRKYNTAEFREKVNLIRKLFDRPAITTDIITGFPGETEEEFARTVEFVREIHFAGTHIFKYSRRDGTRAAVMPDQVSEKTKHSRSLVLMDLDKKNRLEYAASFVGDTVEVLFEEVKVVDGNRFLIGHTRRALPAACPENGEISSGAIKQLKVRGIIRNGILSV